jgi:small subunit ribosomal protein S15
MTETKTNWVKTKPEELSKLVLDLHKEGNSPAKIGLILRDKHGIPKSKLAGKKITQILDENKLTYKTDKDVLNTKITELESHIKQHKHDFSAKRSLSKTLWAIKRQD